MARRVLGQPRTMMRALVVAALAGDPGTSPRAGTYVGLGVGSTASRRQHRRRLRSSNGRNGRLRSGYAARADVGSGRSRSRAACTGFGAGPNGYARPTTLDELRLGGKFSLPLGERLRGFGRLGVERTWPQPTTTASTSFAAMATCVGAGFEYRLERDRRVSPCFVDYGIRSTTRARRLADVRRELGHDASTRSTRTDRL